MDKNETLNPLELEKALVSKARNSPYYFIWYLIQKKPADHHERWLKMLFNPDFSRINIIAPRESAKTTILVYSLVWYISKNPLSTNAIVSVSKEQAKTRLDMIFKTIVSTPQYRNVFPNIEIDRNRSSTQVAFSVWDKSYGSYEKWVAQVTQRGSMKDPTLFVTGAFGRGFIGKRISGWLVMDDIVDQSLATDSAQDDMMLYIQQTLEPCVQAGGRIINIGTRWLLNDIYERFMNNPAWVSDVTPAIYYDNGVARSYWPEYWPLDKLEKKRAVMNDDRLFKIMYMCDVTANNFQLFSNIENYYYAPEELKSIKFQLFISTDWATSTKQRADYTVFSAMAVTNNCVYLLDMRRYKAKIEDSIKYLFDFVDEMTNLYGVLSSVIIENVAFQSVIQTLVTSTRPDIPVVGVNPKGDKVQRARVVSTMMHQDRFKINPNLDPEVMRVLRLEAQNFGNYPHDDTIDSLSLLFQYIRLNYIDASTIIVKPKKPFLKL